MGIRARRAPSAFLAALLAAPFAAVGVCGVVAPFAVPPASCTAEAAPGDCCSRSGVPAGPRAPASDRCAACGAAACASLAGERGPAAPGRRTAAVTVEARPGIARCFDGSAMQRALIILSESPPKFLLLATFRN